MTAFDSYVITITDNDKSVEVAERCISSAKKFGIDVSKFKAFTPKDDLKTLFKRSKITDFSGFDEKYSRTQNCMAAFLSHFSLWWLSWKKHRPILILEHDAVFVNGIPNLPYIGTSLISFGAPSYGNYRNDHLIGLNPLISKPYLPGAHGYLVTPKAAERLIIQAQRIKPLPTDIFLNINTFPFIQEYYPWPIIAKDSFTTIQNTLGCLAKHNYGKNYEIL